MGKETKIGLGVIGILLVVFGTLLARKLATVDSADTGQTASQAAANSPERTASLEKPQVVTAQKGEPHAGIGKAMWATGGSAVAAADEAESDVPRASYLPDERAPTEAAPRERYAQEEAPAAEETSSERPAMSARANPFQKKQSPTRDDDQDGQGELAPPRTLRAQDETALEPMSQPPVKPARSGVRRLSAQVPLETPADTSDTGPADLATEPGPIPQAAGDDAQPISALSREDDAPAEPGASIRSESRQADAGWVSAVDRTASATSESGVPQNGKYTIQPNDTLWTVAEKVYGNGRYFKAIAEHNRGKYPHPDRLTVGTVISVPSVALLEQNYPSLVPKQRRSAVVTSRTIQASARGRVASSANNYVVEEGDTLFDIARHALGKASRWAEIYDLNREALGEDFDYLQPGTELAMPAKGGSNDPITQRTPGYQR